MCFIDFEKAFDKVRRSEVFQILQQIGLDTADRKLIKNLYLEQNASVLINNDMTTDQIEIKRKFRQDFVSSPTLFNVYADFIFPEALSDRRMSKSVVKTSIM